MTVQLKDGGVLQGEWVTSVPGEHVVLRLATGEVRTLEWGEILAPERIGASIGAPSPRLPSEERVGALPGSPLEQERARFISVPLELTSPKLRLEKLQDVEGATPVTVCEGVCRVSVATRGMRYRIVSPVTTTQWFAVETPQRYTLSEASTGRTVGGIALTAGGVLMMAGSIFLFGYALANVDGNDVGGFMAGYVGGLGGTLAGAAIASLGTYLLITTHGPQVEDGLGHRVALRREPRAQARLRPRLLPHLLGFRF